MTMTNHLKIKDKKQHLAQQGGANGNSAERQAALPHLGDQLQPHRSPVIAPGTISNDYNGKRSFMDVLHLEINLNCRFRSKKTKDKEWGETFRAVKRESERWSHKVCLSPVLIKIKTIVKLGKELFLCWL